MEVHILLRVYPLLFSWIWFLKFVSYHHIWHDVRYHVSWIHSKLDKKDYKSKAKRLEKKDDDLSKAAKDLNLPEPILKSVMEYPTNVSLVKVIVFCLLPTLNFQLKYPFSNKRNYKRYVLRMLEYGAWQILWVIIIMEYVTPLVYDCWASIKREDYTTALYYFTRLAVPNTYCWLIMFYSHFHTYLNAYADLTGFSDRCFYLDWWNSTSFSQYWRKWNLPVHNWLTRHIYFPSMRRGYSKTVSMCIVFFFSAVMHEVLIYGLIQKLSLIGFNSMAIQLPFIIIQETYKKQLGGNVGNFFFWIVFWVIGQPAGMVMGFIILS